MDTADKATNKAMSAAYKYMAMQVFCIPTQGDNDADAHTPEPAKRESATERAARQTTHDPSWPADQARYFARLAELGLSKETVDSYCASMRTDRPSQLPQERRDKLVNYLASEAGRAAIVKLIGADPNAK